MFKSAGECSILNNLPLVITKIVIRSIQTYIDVLSIRCIRVTYIFDLFV